MPRMDAIKIFLGAVVTLLLGALVMSWKDFRHQVRNTPPAELAKLKSEIADIRLEQERLRTERARILGTEVAAPVPEAPRIARAEEIPETGGVYEDEVLPVPDDLAGTETAAEPETPAASEVDRAQAIKSAPPVARIAEWVVDGGFGIAEVLDPAVVKKDAILCVRRNSGILGRLKIGEVTPEGAIANAMARFPGPKPEPGDELIVEPE